AQPAPDAVERPEPDAPAASPAAEGADREAPAEDPDRPDAAQHMKDALDLRRAQAQAALREQAGATDEQMDQVDQIVAGMNADLESLATDFVAASGQGEPSRHDLMVFASDTLDVLINTEESLGTVLDEDQIHQLTADALDPTAYVDGGVVDVLS